MTPLPSSPVLSPPLTSSPILSHPLTSSPILSKNHKKLRFLSS